MKIMNFLLLIPLVLFGLERVNLIRNSSFEKDDSVWVVETGAWAYPNPAVGNNRDDSAYVSGLYSGSVDTREIPIWQEDGEGDSAVLKQKFLFIKKVSDLDSLCWQQLIQLINSSSQASAGCLIGLTYANPERNGFGYGFIPPWGFGVDFWVDVSKKISEEDTLWHEYKKNLKIDFVDQLGVDTNEELSHFVLIGWGDWVGAPSWHGHKTYWDDIRLTGYADYDVGVKEILSGDSVWAGVDYKPVARIKSFGREPADDFLAIAEIRQGESLVWADTIPYTLPADTEDTLEFDSFPIPNALSYTLTVRTEMSPDECDEDDQVSQTLFGTAVAEPVTHPDAVTLEVQSFTSNPRISYSLPDGQSGVLRVYDASGRKVKSLKVQGSGEVEFSAQSSGVYFVRLEAGRTSIVKKTVVK